MCPVTLSQKHFQPARHWLAAHQSPVAIKPTKRASDKGSQQRQALSSLAREFSPLVRSKRPFKMRQTEANRVFRIPRESAESSRGAAVGQKPLPTATEIMFKCHYNSRALSSANRRTRIEDRRTRNSGSTGHIGIWSSRCKGALAAQLQLDIHVERKEELLRRPGQLNQVCSRISSPCPRYKRFSPFAISRGSRHR